MQSKTRINEELDSAIRLSLEKFEQRFQDRIMANYNNMTLPCTTTSQSFSKHDFEEVAKMLKELPPIATEMEVFPSGYINMFADFKKAIDISQQGYYPGMGIRVTVIQEDNELKENQTRIKYNDGTSKIIDIF